MNHPFTIVGEYPGRISAIYLRKVGDDEKPLKVKACELENGIEGRANDSLALAWSTEVLDVLRKLARTSHNYRDELSSEVQDDLRHSSRSSNRMIKINPRPPLG
jgi:phosphatidate phosphatase APP1